MKYERIRGMHDIVPDEIGWWQQAESVLRETARRYNYHEIRFPVVEYTELFSRGMGESTDVVGKEMYTFLDRGGRSLSLRPEGTASVVRAYIDQGWPAQAPFQKLFYMGPMFRYEKPQKGRCRQFHQFGVEALGSLDPGLDVEVIRFALSMMTQLGMGGLWLRLNSIGCSEDREAYRAVLREHFAEIIHQMCSDCQRRYVENPLRILDCKEASCQAAIETAPGSADHLCCGCADHFERVRTLLDAIGCEYRMDPRLVRGIDYYTRTVFELMSHDLGSQDTLLGGGRYDGLVETFGGPATPGVGFAGGFERLVLILREQAEHPLVLDRLDLFLATLGEAGRQRAVVLAESLRAAGVSVDLDHRDRGLRKQLAWANQLGARCLMVVGDDEAQTGMGRIKQLDSGQEDPIALDPLEMAAFVQKET